MAFALARRITGHRHGHRPGITSGSPAASQTHNGAVMGGCPNQVTEEALLNAFGTPSTEKCMKSLQDGKLVFLCVQNAATKFNAEALQGVQDFKAESQYSGVTEIVKLDPTDSAEASFLGDLKIDPKTKVAVTASSAWHGSRTFGYDGDSPKLPGEKCGGAFRERSRSLP